MQASLKKPQNRLKHIQSEHFSKLLFKHSQETKLLEDMRSFCKQRAVLDKEYGQSLQKLCFTYLDKKGNSTLQNLLSVGHRSVWDIWKSYLWEFNVLALSRLKSAEVHHRLSLELKPVKSVRVAVSKRIFEQIKSLQNDLAASMQEMVKSQKIYSEEEKQAYEIRVKAMNVEDKLRQRSTNLFNTMAQLHRNHAKLSQRRGKYEKRSAGARNEYLFQLTAINAHLDHYLKTDIPDLVQILDGDVYNHFREVLSKTSETELEICRHHQDPFKVLLEQSLKIDRTTAWANFIKESPVFSEDVKFQFEPRDGDTVTSLVSVNAKESCFEQVAQKLARRFVTRERQIKAYREEINDLYSGRIKVSPGMTNPLTQDFDAGEDSGALNQEYVENKVEELEFAIRREEIEKTKINACLELLKKTHVDVQAALYEANLSVEVAAAAAATEAEKAQYGASSSSTAATGSSSAEGSTVGLMGTLTDSAHRKNSLLLGSTTAPLTSSTSRSATQNGGVCRTSAQQLANDAWARVTTSTNTGTTGFSNEPPFIQMDDEDSSRQLLQLKRDSSPEVDWTEGGRLLKATAMYEFLAARKDEINMVCNEKVVLLGIGDGEDWVMVRSLLDGKEGLVPRAFLSIDLLPPPAPHHPAVSFPAANSVTDQESFAKAPSTPPPSCLAAAPHPPMTQCLAGQFVRALINFEGTAEDELSFPIGAVIHVLGRPAVGEVDDGWIEGELVPLSDTEVPAPLTRGVFPSMLVEAVRPEDTWERRLNASRQPQPAKTLLSAEFCLDCEVSPNSDRRRMPSSGSALSSRSSNLTSRSKSRPTSSRRSASRSQKRSGTLNHQISSSQRSSHRQPQQGPGTSKGGRSRTSYSPTATVKPASPQISPLSPSTPPPVSTHSQHEVLSSAPNEESKTLTNHTNDGDDDDEEELQIAEL